MPGVQLECEQGVGVVEEPHLPSEEEELAASVDNANFGPQDKTETEREASTGRTMSNIVYNINVDVVNAHPASNFSEDNQDQIEEAHDSNEVEERGAEDTSTQNAYVTRSGRRSNPPDRLIDGGTYLSSRTKCKINRRQVHMERDKKTDVDLSPITISEKEKEIFGIILEQMSLKGN